MSEKISVIIPVYNVKEYLEKCVESVCTQSYSDLEILLIDDGSTDGSGNLCDELAKEDERILVVHQENGGLSDARNTGLFKATGQYITFLDSDDYIHPDTYKSMWSELKKQDADVVLAGMQNVYDSDGKDIKGTGKVNCITGREAVTKMYASGEDFLVTVVAWNKLYRRDALPEGFAFPKGRVHEDEYTSYQVLYPLNKVVFLDKSFYYYRQRKDSIMHTDFSLKRLDALPAMKEAVEYYDSHEEAELTKEAVKRYLNYIMIMYDNVIKYLPEKRQVKKELKKLFFTEYHSHQEQVKEIPKKRRYLYKLFMYSRPMYLLIKKIRG